MRAIEYDRVTVVFRSGSLAWRAQPQSIGDVIWIVLPREPIPAIGFVVSRDFFVRYFTKALDRTRVVSRQAEKGKGEWVGERSFN